MRTYVGILLVLLGGAALLSSVLERPMDPPLLVDEVSPGPWRDYAAFPTVRPQVVPQMLVTPCPIGPTNMPAIPFERKA